MNTLVTAEDFAAFLRGGEYFNPKHWRTVAPPRPGGDEVLRRIRWRWALRRQPVLGASWFEADAYARWRGGRLPLASEAEAARRGQGAGMQVAEWCLDYYFPGAKGPYVRPQPPVRRRVEGWSVAECLAPTMSDRAIAFRVVMRPLEGFKC